MKKYVSEFVQRGLFAAGFGPIVLAVVYGILGATGAVVNLTPAEVCKGILSVVVMAFIAGGITMVYSLDRLPLISAILLHAGVLYVDYLIMYLVNHWLPRNLSAFGIFTTIFVVGYAVIWLCIFFATKVKTEQLNRKLRAENTK